MRKKKHPACPYCKNKETIKWGRQSGRQRYKCTNKMTCGRSFFINHKEHNNPLWIPYIDGISFRKLGNENGITGAQASRIVREQLDALPENTWFTKTYCSRWSGMLLVDGKFVKVKGYSRSIPFVYCIDYLTHDIVTGVLAPAESAEVFQKLFRLVKTCRYPLQVVICDDIVSALNPAILSYYPKANIQLCHTHYLENIRRQLKVRTQPTHIKFFVELETIFKNHTQSKTKRAEALRALYVRRAKKNLQRQTIIADIMKREHHLFYYRTHKQCPYTTNLIELYNSHLNPRLRALKGFKSFQSAQRWLNAWMLRRRTLALTDCSPRFKHMNGNPPIYFSLKNQAELPELLQNYQLKM